MLGSPGGSDSAIKIDTYPIVENSSDVNISFSSHAQSDPLFSDAKSESNVKLNQRTNTRYPMKRSASDLVVVSQTGNRDSTTSSTQTGVRFQEEGNREAKPTQLHRRTSLRPTAQRSSSSSQVELRSRYHNPAISSASLQQQLIEQTRPTSNRPLRPWRVRPVPTANGPLYKMISQAGGPAPTRYTAMRSNSTPDLPKILTRPNKPDHSVPLKPCIKNKAKSATTTPPGEFKEGLVDSENRTLRRVKTVDFEENGPKPLLSLPLGGTPERPEEGTPVQLGTPLVHHGKPKKTVKRPPSCPSTIGTTKSSLADPAVTRTDVHVIAIAPSWGIEDVASDEGIDPATPTMQIVESKNGIYEVIWDDVPPEHSIRHRRRRSSSASHALETVGSTATRGLERVNTKLTDWSGTWNGPSESFKPTIVVFPDDDGRAPQYDCAVEDDENLIVLAPPNSQRTSAAQSRFPSRPASAPMTRVASEENITLETALHETPPHGTRDWAFSPEQSLVVPNPDGRPGRIAAASRRRTQPAAARKLSNIEEADLKFREHRDSVTIAHSRLIRSGGLSPELFAHRDSVSIAKKRMHARNHATSAARDIPRAKDAQLDALNLVDDDDVSVASLPTVEEHAVQAFKNSSSASILCSQQQPVDNQRHMRIVE